MNVSCCTEVSDTMFSGASVTVYWINLTPFRICSKWSGCWCNLCTMPCLMNSSWYDSVVLDIESENMKRTRPLLSLLKPIEQIKENPELDMPFFFSHNTKKEHDIHSPWQNWPTHSHCHKEMGITTAKMARTALQWTNTCLILKLQPVTVLLISCFRSQRKILAVQTSQAVLFYYIQREKRTCTYTVKSQATYNI